MTKNNLTTPTPMTSWRNEEKSVASDPASDELSSCSLKRDRTSFASFPTARGTWGAMLLVAWLALLTKRWHVRRKGVREPSDEKTNTKTVTERPVKSAAAGKERWTLGLAMDAMLRSYSDRLINVVAFRSSVGGRQHEEELTRRKAPLCLQERISEGHDSVSRLVEEARRCHSSAQESVSSNGCAPKHVAVIMDGNRRFGRIMHGDPLKGHADGGKKLGEFVQWCMEAGVSMVTAFAFSTENWKRDAHEVEMLMDLVCKSCGELMDDAVKNNTKIRVLTSDTSKLPGKVVEAIRKAEEETRDCSGFSFNICLSYGARQEIANACREIARDVQSGVTALDAVTDTMVEGHLSTAGLPDPDVLIRTSGEKRMAYTELFFVDKLWPEVTKDDILEIFKEYQQRERRFGC